jgi:hypothetical protein
MRAAAEQVSDAGRRFRTFSRLAAQEMLSGGGTQLSLVAMKHLPQLGIDGCVVIAFANPLQRIGEGRVVLGFHGRGAPAHEQTLQIRDLVPAKLTSLLDGSCLILPVSFGDQPLGFAVVALSSKEGALYEQLREVFGTMLKGSALAREIHYSSRPSPAVR